MLLLEAAPVSEPWGSKKPTSTEHLSLDHDKIGAKLGLFFGGPRASLPHLLGRYCASVRMMSNSRDWPSNPIPGRSDTWMNPPSILASSANPPKAPNTPGYDSAPPRPKPAAIAS